MIGGNLIGGWAHSRDLMYASKLFTSYNTEAKIFETLELAQACGINTIQMDPACWDAVSKYNQQRSTKIQTMVCVSLPEDKAKMNDDDQTPGRPGGHAALFARRGDRRPHDERRQDGRDRADGRSDQGPGRAGRRRRPLVEHAHGLREEQARSRFLREDLPHGPLLVGHAQGAAEGIRLDGDGHLGDHDANNDNMWCNNPEETAAFMETVEKPWVAFKVMAAGAIPPRMAFPYAYRHGADFVIAGMFDFQVETDVKIAIESLQAVGSRKRPWRG